MTPTMRFQQACTGSDRTYFEIHASHRALLQMLTLRYDP